jgi:hypothetical protein
MMRTAIARRLSLTLFSLVCAPLLCANEVLIPRGSTWRSLDDGSNQGIAWRVPSFDDSSWAFGPGQLGYGDGDESTVVGFGPDPDNKYVATYFRHEFNVVNPASYTRLLLRVLHDDGAAIYLNGNEIARANMPAGPILFDTFAASTQSNSEEDYFTELFPALTYLIPGTNDLTVEVHQRTATSSDLSFDLELFASPAELVMRGPYLQQAAPDRITVRWRTDTPTDSRVSFGTTQGVLNQMVDDLTLATEHSVELTGLSPDTTYYYAIGKTTGILVGDDADHFFITPPLRGTRQPFRAWVLGDSGRSDIRAARVRDAYTAFTGATYTDLVLMLGDNAYDNGTDAEYQSGVFGMYPDVLEQSVVWSTRGNHETSSSTYVDIFTHPTAAEAGGVASGSEVYYSFDRANVHFICLDSFGSNREVGGPMWNWLETDLAANDQDWTVAFWHHPPYSKGSHDSDTEDLLMTMRANFLPLIEQGGVDLVLCGHSHSYERSHLIDGHYGLSGTYGPSMTVDDGDGDPNGDGAYQKTPGPNAGAVYSVPGSSSQISGGDLNHPVMEVNLNLLGSVVLDFDGDRLDVRFIDDLGTIQDTYRIEQTDLFKPYCFSAELATPCPCGNEGSVGHGCENTGGLGGVRLDALGDPVLNNVTMTGAGYPAMGAPTVIAIRSTERENGGFGVVFGDGLRCIGLAGFVRLNSTIASGGASTTPVMHGAMAGSGAFAYQLWYRSTPIMFCDPAAAFNLSNGLTIDWP